MTKLYEHSLVWKNSILIKPFEEVDFDKLQISEHEEKILRYVAGYIPFSLKKQFWPKRHEGMGFHGQIE